MGGASKLLMVLTSPFPLLYPRCSARRLTLHPHIITTASFSSFPKRKLSSVSTTGPLLPFSITLTSEAARTNTANVAREDFDFETEIPSPSPLPNSKISKPWPEWSKLLDSLRSNGYFENLQFELEGENDFSLFENLDEEDAIKMFEKLREEFLSSAKACLAFAHQHSDLLGSLSRKDIEVVVGNGSPFLFVSSVDSARRMKSFLSCDFRIQSVLGNELELDTAHTVDLMRFILSYVYDASAFLDVNGLKNWEMVESSIRNLLSEIADASRGGQEFGLSSPKQHSDGYEQTTSSLGQKLEMKKGDWICAKCSFMNFSRNMKCLECSEERPKRLLTGGEWECPQCDFFNYGRNVECLRCDCKRPGDASFGTVESRSSMGYGNESYLRTGGKTNTRTSRLKKRFSDTTNHGNNLRSMDGASPGSTLSQKLDSVLGRSSSAAETSPGRSTMSQKLDTILGRSSSAAEMNNDAAAAEETTAGIGRTTFSNTSSPQSWISEANKSGYVPFVPLPADMFGKPQKPTEAEEVLGLQNSAEPKSSGFGKSTDSIPLSEKPVKQIKTKEDEEQDEKSERWSKKVSELHDVTDLASAISDEEFPEIMPMRKGENRFVVSKKKDRSLTSPLQKRQMAMEQTSSTKFVPFVPFPPDYFAKKDKEPETGIASRTSEIQGVPQESEERKIASPNSWAIPDSPLSVNNGQSSENNWNTSLSGKSINKSLADYGPAENSSQIPNDLQTSMGGMGNNGPSPSPIESSAQQFENTKNTKDSWKAGFTGKSLEGSLVKEPDPLDMSEEAKAERWFRRAAQIKDISELSQIPDEDFPQIMPMRKGVNRFVVSKRKTPLERRLTSPQYRRNLPTVSSEPIKENTES